MNPFKNKCNQVWFIQIILVLRRLKCKGHKLKDINILPQKTNNSRTRGTILNPSVKEAQNIDLDEFKAALV